MKKRTPLIIAAGLLLNPFSLGALVMHYGSQNQTEQVAAKPEPLTFEQKAQRAVDKNSLSMRWSCEKAIKKQLRDPGSYQAVSVRYWPSMEETALVHTKISYRAKNGFGGYAVGGANCHYDGNGKMTRFNNA